MTSGGTFWYPCWNWLNRDRGKNGKLPAKALTTMILWLMAGKFNKIKEWRTGEATRKQGNPLVRTAYSKILNKTKSYCYYVEWLYITIKYFFNIRCNAGIYFGPYNTSHGISRDYANSHYLLTISGAAAISSATTTQFSGSVGIGATEAFFFHHFFSGQAWDYSVFPEPSKSFPM